MLIKPGVDAKAAAAAIDRAINATTTTEGFASDYDAVVYTDWVHGLERTLREFFVDVPTDRLYTEQFWRAQGPILSRRMLVTQEAERQVAWLADVRDTVSNTFSRFAEGERSILVLDTNVLLHHRPLSDIDWISIAGAKDAVLLAVPVRVVHELDARKYVGTKAGDRARKRISLLSDYATAGAVRPGVDVEIVSSVDLDPDAGRTPPIPADTEILETCEALRAYAGSNRVHLVTGDLAMQIVAETLGIDVRRMPDETMQPLGSEES